MRIIHTSDWHIGRRFERESLEGDQRSFLIWLAELVAAERVDLVVVAGDVYDRSQPSEDAVAILDGGLDALCTAGAQVAMISGNHDSARRLGFGAGRQALGGVHVFADDRRPPVPRIVTAGDERVALVAVPFLDPHVATAPHPADDGTLRPATHQNVLADALDAGRAALAALDPMPAIAVAHAYVSGAGLSDSERTLAIGGADQVDPAVLGGFDYVALGHLHRPQRIGGSDTVAYSGSPLPYSFSEDHPKSVRLVEVTGGRIGEVSTVPVPVGRQVTTLTGTLRDLLTDPAHERFRGHWVAARLTDDNVQTQPMERLRARFPHAVSLRYDNPSTGAMVDFGTTGPPIEDRAEEDVILEFLEEVRDRPPFDSERALVLDALAAALTATVAEPRP
jgi:exonuclease SbcD